MDHSGSTVGRPSTNHELARALLARDPSAPRLAFARFSPKVRRVMRRALCAQLDVEDSIQEVFFQFFRGVAALRNPEAMEAFAIAIAVRTARRFNQRERARRRLLEPLSTLPRDEARGTADVAASHALTRLQSVLARIRCHDRTAFVLRFIAGMRVEEIARHVGASPATVRRRFSRAFTRLTYFASEDSFLADYLRERVVLTDRRDTGAGQHTREQQSGEPHREDDVCPKEGSTCATSRPRR